MVPTFTDQKCKFCGHDGRPEPDSSWWGKMRRTQGRDERDVLVRIITRAGPNVYEYKRKDNATPVFRQCRDHLLFSKKTLYFSGKYSILI